ncbi:hypothetical protein FACS1894147_07930 [Spirochaetia bacterium]|nr:hypothetical protein FACS1894147_07930 [Spirochaetia bacterium]
MLEYILKPNTVGTAPVGLHAQTVQTEERTTADFVRVMAETKGGATEGEAAQWLDVMRRSFISELSRGCNVNLAGFLSAQATMKGDFPTSDSPFDSTRNTIHGSINFSPAINKILAAMPSRRVSDASSGIYIEHIIDIASGKEDSKLTPGMGERIRGSKIKVAGEHPLVGLYLTDADGNDTKVALTAIIRNGPAEIEFVCPLLAPGEYTLRITTMFSNGHSLLNAPRSYTFPTPLTIGVAPAVTP